MLQALRECRCIEDAYENAWKTWAKIWDDAEVDSKARQAWKQAKTENANRNETHRQNSAIETSKTNYLPTNCYFRSCPPRRPLVGRIERKLIQTLL